MKHEKYINILVDEATHKKFKGLLKRRRKGERVQYILGTLANDEMQRMTRTMRG